MGIEKRKKTTLGGKASIFAAALFGCLAVSSEASAVLVSPGGIPIEVNNGGQIIFEQFDQDTLITGPNSILQGVGLVSQIRNSLLGSTPTYLAPCASVGCTGSVPFLADVFGNFTVRAVVPNNINPALVTGQDIYLTGGFLDYYVLAARPNQNTGSIATDIANSSAGALWLHLVPEVFDDFGDTFHIFVPGGSLSTFSGNAQGDAFLDVVGPALAAALFDTNGFLNACSIGALACHLPPQLADFQFIGNAVRLQAANAPPGTCPTGVDFCVQGSDNVLNNQPTQVPEPGSLLLLATGLLSLAGAGMGRRRRSRA